MYLADEFEGKVRATFSASGRANDEALEVSIVLLARQPVAEIEVWHTAARRRKQREKQHIPLSVTLCELHNRLNHCRQILRLYMFGDVQILIRFHRRR